MADKVDMSLDDIIKMNRRQKPATNKAPIRRNQNNQQSNAVRNNFRQQRRTNPYERPSIKPKNGRWKHDLFDGQNKPAHLMIGNLHFRVSDTDIKELFKEFGVIKRATVHYDKSGRSLGNAEVVFANKISAIKARDKYNDVLLDGRKMKITLVSDNPTVTNVSNNRSNPRKQIGGGNRFNNQAKGRPRNGPSNRPATNGGLRQKKPVATKEQLDADLDAYINKN